jgi:GWxTD domain-containing protein
MVAVVSACATTSRYGQTNAAVFYQETDPEALPEYRIFHTSDGLSRLYFKIPAANLLYISKGEATYTARIQIQYVILPEMNNIQVLDSGSVDLADQRVNPNEGTLMGYVEIKTPARPPLNKLVAVVTLRDLNRKTERTLVLDISRKNHQDRQFFLITDTTGYPQMTDQIQLRQPLRIAHTRPEVRHLKVRYYQRKFPVAEPPYSDVVIKSFKYEADSTYDLDIAQMVSFDMPGFYHLQLNDTLRNGLTLFHFGTYFPNVGVGSDLGGPLRYITNNREFEYISKKASDSTRLAAEQFWLRAAGNAERARIAIKEYYSRVELANRFFTSYVEGWKTDRGMMYIIYGPPTTVYQTPVGETWVYGAENSILPYQFKFIKVENPFSNNDFELTRMSSARYGWGKAIESWRSGRPYSSRDIKREQDEREQQNRLQQRPAFWY